MAHCPNCGTKQAAGRTASLAKMVAVIDDIDSDGKISVDVMGVCSAVVGPDDPDNFDQDAADEFDAKMMAMVKALQKAGYDAFWNEQVDGDEDGEGHPTFLATIEVGLDTDNIKKTLSKFVKFR